MLDARLKKPVSKSQNSRIYDLKEVSKMSRGDGTGPSDQGPGTGRGLRRGRVDGGRGKGPGFAAGPGGS